MSIICLDGMVYNITASKNPNLNLSIEGSNVLLGYQKFVSELLEHGYFSEDFGLLQQSLNLKGKIVKIECPFHI